MGIKSLFGFGQARDKPVRNYSNGEYTFNFGRSTSGKLNVDGLLRGDYQSRMNGYAIGRQNGWLSTNDIREMEDMNPLPEEEGGNLYLVNGAMTKLKDAGAFAKEGTESTGKETEPQQPPDNKNRGGLR